MPKKWNVLLLDTKRKNPNHYLCLALKTALEHCQDVNFVEMPLLGNAIQVAKQRMCNLFIAFDGEELHFEICNRLKTICGTAVLWVTEDPYEININTKNSEIFDIIFTNDSSSVQRYGYKGRHLPLAADINLHHMNVKFNEKDFRYDLFFAGTAWPNRIKFISKLIKNLYGVKTKFLLPYNAHLESPKNIINLPESSFIWRISNKEFIAFSNRSRITLSLHREFTVSPGGSPMAETPGPRLFEIALAGGFQLVDGRLSEVKKYFDEGTEYISFNSVEDAVDKIAYYLNHTEERYKIALAAQKRVLSEHLYNHRVNEIFRNINDIDAFKLKPTAPKSVRILQVCHNIISKPPCGGIEHYQEWIRSSFKNDKNFEFFFMVPNNLGAPKSIEIYNCNLELIDNYEFESLYERSILSDPIRERFFANFLTAYNISVVHFQHLIGYPPSFPLIAKALAIKTIFSVHDYYILCDKFNLIDHSGKYCQIESINITQCDFCLYKSYNASMGNQAARRSFFNRVFRSFDTIIYNTREVKERIEKVIPTVEYESHISPVPISVNGIMTTKKSAEPLKIAIIGNFINSKGADFLLDVFEATKNDKVKYKVLGFVDHSLSIEELKKKFSKVEFLGGYNPSQLSTYLFDCSAALFSSKWPETFCLSLSECWLHKLIPIAPNIGAFSVRIKHDFNGYLYPLGNVDCVVGLVNRLIYDSDCRAMILENIKPDLYDNEGSHKYILNSIYKNNITNFVAFDALDKKDGVNSDLTLFDTGIALQFDKWLHQSGMQWPSQSVHQNNLLSYKEDSINSTKIKLGLQEVFAKAYRYNKSHGFRNTFNRILFELRKRHGM